MDDSNTARGNAMGTRLAEVYISNSAITGNSRPLPTKSSMYFQRNCINSTNTTMKNVSMNGPRKDLIVSL